MRVTTFHILLRPATASRRRGAADLNLPSTTTLLNFNFAKDGYGHKGAIMLGLASYLGFLGVLGLVMHVGFSRANPYQRGLDPMLARYMVWLRNSYRAPGGTPKSS